MALLGGFPKIAPSVVLRDRLQSWLLFHDRVPLRYLAAMPGAGKTTAVVLYARFRDGIARYVRLLPGATPADVFTAVARAAGAAGAPTYADLLAALAGAGRLEIIIDEVDNAGPDARLILESLYRDVEESVTFIYSGRARDAVPVAAGAVAGLAVICDPSLLTFDTGEITLFAESLGVHEDPISLSRLRDATDGWALPIAGTLRAAAAQRRRLNDAYAQWLRQGPETVNVVVQTALRGAGPEMAGLFEDAILGRAPAEVMPALERSGLFVIETNGRLRFNRIVTLCGTSTLPEAERVERGPAVLEMFGRFELTIGEQVVRWQRRRDKQIVQYLALRSEGSASRAELIATFWPDADPQLAGQSLRTACSTIRKAIGEVVGMASVDRYFVAGTVVELRFDEVISTARRFRAHVYLGEAAFAVEDPADAYAHYYAAERLYRAPLLSGEPEVPWAAAEVGLYAEMYRIAIERLAQLGSIVSSRDIGQQVEAQATA